MFKKTIGLEIDSWYAIDFTRLLGELGLEFRFGDEQYHIDERDSRRKHYFRRWVVRGSRAKIECLLDRLRYGQIDYTML